jgi:hypothetical protein
VVPDRPLPVPDPEVDIRVRWRLPRPLSVWRRAWETHIVSSGRIRAPPVAYNSVGAQLRSLRLCAPPKHIVPGREGTRRTSGGPGTTRAARARRGERRAGRRVASSTTAATYVLGGRQWDAGASPGGCYASPTHRRAARAVDIACSTRCRELERLPLSSPRIGNACLRHVPGNAACRRFELPWGSPTPGTACLLRAPRNAPCRQRQTSGSPRAGTACPLRAPFNAPYRVEPTWCSPRAGTACPRRAPRSGPCRLEQTSGSPPPGTACPRRAPHSGPCRLERT